MNDEPTIETPASPVLDEPRLSIGHLMVWTACVAFYCAAFQTLTHVIRTSPVEGWGVLHMATQATISGTALAVLPLLIVRRVRGRRFPRYGGEFLWLLAAVASLLRLLQWALYALDLSFPSSRQVSTILQWGSLIVWCGVYLYAILGCRQRRWKIVFLFMASLNLLVPLLFFVAVRSISGPAFGNRVIAITLGKQFLVVAAVAVAAVVDLRQAQRYPWPHWVGILLRFCELVMTVFLFAVRMI